MDNSVILSTRSRWMSSVPLNQAEFRVGPGKERRYCNKKSLEDLSPRMKETLYEAEDSSGRVQVTWEKVDIDTLHSLAEFAKSGNYTSQERDPIQVDPNHDLACIEGSIESEGFYSRYSMSDFAFFYHHFRPLYGREAECRARSSTGGHSPPSRQYGTYYTFGQPANRQSIDRKYAAIYSFDQWATACFLKDLEDLETSHGDNEDELDHLYQTEEMEPEPRMFRHDPVFLCHARLYAIASQYRIEKLKRLSLFRLYRALWRFPLHGHAAGTLDVVALIEFVFLEMEDYCPFPFEGDTEDEEEDEDVEWQRPIKDLVVLYARTAAETLSAREVFRARCLDAIPEFKDRFEEDLDLHKSFLAPMT